jgi:hypothetical protein
MLSSRCHCPSFMPYICKPVGSQKWYRLDTRIAKVPTAGTVRAHPVRSGLLVFSTPSHTHLTRTAAPGGPRRRWRGACTGSTPRPRAPAATTFVRASGRNGVTGRREGRQRQGAQRSHRGAQLAARALDACPPRSALEAQVHQSILKRKRDIFWGKSNIKENEFWREHATRF